MKKIEDKGITLGQKADYATGITTKFPGVSLDSIRDEVIVCGNKLLIIEIDENTENLCTSKDEDESFTIIRYARDDSYDISRLEQYYSECEEDK